MSNVPEGHIMTPKFRLSFPDIWQPKSFQGGKPKYSCVMLFDKSIDISELKRIANEAVNGKWPDKSKRKSLRNPFKDGDEKEYNGYANCITVNAGSLYQPTVYGPDGKVTLDQSTIVAGYYYRALVNCYAYDTAGNRGISFGLQGIQLVEEGEAFANKVDTDSAFGAVSGYEPSPAQKESFGAAQPEPTDDMF